MTATQRHSPAPAKLAALSPGVSVAVLSYRPLEARVALKLMSISLYLSELYFFLCLLAGSIQNFLRNRFRRRFTPNEIRQPEQRSQARL